MKLLRPSMSVSLTLLLLAVLGAVLAVGCGSQESSSPPAIAAPASGGDTGGGGGGGDDGGGDDELVNTVTVAIDPATLTAGDAGAEVTATVEDGNGQPVPNAAVVFAVSPTSVASLGANSATTDANGEAKVLITGVRAGSATVTATESGISGTATLTVSAPLVDVFSLAPAGGEIVASTTAGAGATVTFEVTDQGGTPLPGKTVTFTTTHGVLDATSRTTDADGRSAVKLTSQQVGTALVSATVLGRTSSAATVTIGPAGLHTLSMTPSANTIPSNGSATLSLQGIDAFGNPVESVFVDLEAILLGTGAGTGNVSPSQVELVNGTGQASFTPSEDGVARITAEINGQPITYVDISVELQLAGEPAKIQFDIAEEEREITVKGSGGTESATIMVRVLDVNGDPIADVSNNLSVKIISGPNGGESLDGLATITQTRTLSTSGGTATTILQSGTRPGTVLIQVAVTKGSNGEDLETPLTASVPQITIRAGAPASLFLTRANAIQSPGLRGNGSISHDYLAFVSDLWGNAVPDGTIVFFSQFLNIKAQCRTRSEFDPPAEPGLPAEKNGYVEYTCEGADAGTVVPGGDDTGTRAVFHSGSEPFTDVVAGDTLVILTENNPLGFGGYRIHSVAADEMSVVLDNDFDLDPADPGTAPFLEGLPWAVGNNANLGGSVFTTEGAASTEGGVAVWSNTYAGELVNSSAFVFAEAEGGTQAHARYFGLSWAAETEILQTGGIESGDTVPDRMDLDGDGFPDSPMYQFTFFVRDGSSPTPYLIADLVTDVSTSGGELATYDARPDLVRDEDLLNRSFKYASALLSVKTSSRSILKGDPGGALSFYWSPPDIVGEDTDFNIWVSGGGVINKLTITVSDSGL